MDKGNDKDVDQRIGALFDKAFSFSAPPQPVFGQPAERPMKLSYDELDMLAAAGGNDEMNEIFKRIKAASDKSQKS